MSGYVAFQCTGEIDWCEAELIRRVPYFYDPASVRAVQNFRLELNTLDTGGARRVVEKHVPVEMRLGDCRIRRIC